MFERFTDRARRVVVLALRYIMRHADSAFRASLAMLYLWVPRTSSTSRDQAILVDQATDASLSSDAVLLEVDRFG
jgi:hypothetical protein